MWYYPILHLDKHKSKGTVCSKKGYGCKWTCETIQYYTWTNIKVIVGKDMNVIEHERLSNITLETK
jgi:hypothetical protein